MMPSALGANLLITPSLLTNKGMTSCNRRLMKALLQRFWVIFVLITIGTVADSFWYQ